MNKVNIEFFSIIQTYMFICNYIITVCRQITVMKQQLSPHKKCSQQNLMKFLYQKKAARAEVVNMRDGIC